MIPIRHFIVVFAIGIFFIVYIWQNIEVVKIKMEFERLAALEKVLLLERNRYIAGIEGFRRVEAMDRLAGEKKLKKIMREDIVVIKAGGTGEKR